MKFENEYDFLSNFYPCKITIENITYPTVEHAFQAMKTLDKNERLEISKLLTAGKAKRAGRKVKLREDWEIIKVQTMYDLLKIKFNKPKFKEKLLKIGDIEIIEDNYWNNCFWAFVKEKEIIF